MSRPHPASKGQSSAASQSRGSASQLLPDQLPQNQPDTEGEPQAGSVRYKHTPPHASTQRRLIVNADDFGASEEINEAVIRAFKEGVLTSASLMVTGAAAEQAVKLAKDNPGLGVGIHLVTVVGRSVLPQSEIPTLVDRDGNFSNNPTAAGLKYFFMPRARRELRKELAAQFEKFHATGLRLSHMDGHLHLHVHPVIFNAALELGSKYGCSHMRVPVEERGPALEFDRSHVIQKSIFTILFGGLARYMTRKLRERGFTYPTRVYGNLQSGRMSEGYFLYALEHLEADASEIYFHPAVYPDDKSLNSDECQASIEFEALTSKKVKDRIQALGIRLINYADLDARS
jgi:hopanoid biosynthesis associated protein HpnK